MEGARHVSTTEQLRQAALLKECTGSGCQTHEYINCIYFEDMLQPTVIDEKQQMHKMDAGGSWSDNCLTSIFEEQTTLKY